MSWIEITLLIIGLLVISSVGGRYVSEILYWIFAVIDEFDSSAFDNEGWWFKKEDPTLRDFIYRRIYHTDFYGSFDSIKWIPFYNIVNIGLYVVSVICETLCLIFIKIMQYVVLPIMSFICLKMIVPSLTWIKNLLVKTFQELHLYSIATLIKEFKTRVIDKILDFNLRK